MATTKPVTFKNCFVLTAMQEMSQNLSANIQTHIRGRKVQSINTTSLEGCYILITKPHVSAYNDHRQFSTTIKKSLYICVRVC